MKKLILTAALSTAIASPLAQAVHRQPLDRSAAQASQTTQYGRPPADTRTSSNDVDRTPYRRRTRLAMPIRHGGARTAWLRRLGGGTIEGCRGTCWARAGTPIRGAVQP